MKTPTPLPGRLLVVLVLALVAGLPASADRSPLSTDPLTYPRSWPTAWVAYTVNGQPLADNEASADETTGGTTPTGAVDLTGISLENQAAAYFQGDGDNLYLRFRLNGPPHALSGASQPFVSSSWSVMMDVDGDGYKEFTLMLAGVRDSNNVSPDDLIIMYNDQSTQAGNPETDTIWRQDVAKNSTAGAGYDSTTDGEDGESADWDSNPDAYVWDFGRTRVTQLDRALSPGSNNSKYLLDFQIPLQALDASSRGGPSLNRYSIVRFVFSSANSNTNPFQKDFAYLSGYSPGDIGDPLPPGDPTDLDGNIIERPVITGVDATNICAVGPARLGANISWRTETWNSNQNIRTTVREVEFHYAPDTNGNGLPDETIWTPAGTVTLTATPGTTSVSGGTVTNNLGPWGTELDETALLEGRYFVKARVVAVDDVDDIFGGVVDSLALEGDPEFNPATKAADGPIFASFINTGCGSPGPSLSKSASSAVASIGGTVDFTLTIANPSGSNITLDRLVDNLPAGFAFRELHPSSTLVPTSGPAAGATGDLVWEFGPSGVAVGATPATLVFTADVLGPTGTYSNRAEADTSAGTVASEPVQVGIGQARLALALETLPSSAAPGETVTFEFEYGNYSPVNARNTTLVAELPPELDFVSASDGGVLSGPGGSQVVTWDLADVAAGEGPLTVSFEAQVLDPYPSDSSTWLMQTGTITSDDTAPTAASSVLNVDVPRAQLGLSLTGNAHVIEAGQQVTLTATFVNTSASTASQAALALDIMPGFSFVSATDGGTDQSGTVIWNALGDVQAGAPARSVSVTLVSSSPFTGGNPTTFTAQLDSLETDIVTDTYRVGIQHVPEACTPLNWYLSDQPSNYFPGTSVSSLTVSQPLSPFFSGVLSPADNTIFWTFYQESPLNSTIEGETTISTQFFLNKGSGGNPTILADLYYFDPNNTSAGDVKVGATATMPMSGGSDQPFTPVFTLASGSSIPQGSVLKLVFTKQSGGTFSLGSETIGNDGFISFCTPPPAGPPVLVLDKQADVFSADAGDTIEYTLQYANVGGSQATTVTIEDLLPAGTSFGTVLSGPAATDLGGNSYRFNVDSLSSNASGTIVFTATVDKPLSTSLPILSNEATISADNADSVPDAAVVELRRPSTTVSKSVDRALLGPNSLATYTLDILNTGSGPATEVIVTDTLPVSAGLFELEGAVTIDGVEAPGAVTGADLSVQLPQPLAPGGSATVVYRMRVASSGLPDGTSELGEGLIAEVVDSETNVTTASEDVIVSITSSANLRIDLQVAPAGPVQAGERLTYTVTVENTGASPATGVGFRAPIPSMTTYSAGTIVLDAVAQSDAADADEGSFDAGANRVYLDLGTLAAAESKVVQWTVVVDSVLSAGSNTVTANASASAGNTATKQDSVSVEAEASPALSLVKSGVESAPDQYAAVATAVASSTSLEVDDASYLLAGDLVAVGGVVARVTGITANTLTLDTALTASEGEPLLPVLEYTITYANVGSAAASAVVIEDDLPTGLQYAGATLSPDAPEPAFGADGPLLTWSLSTLEVGDGGTLTVRGIPSTSGRYDNTARIASAEVTTPVPSNQVSTQVGMLRVAKETAQVDSVHNDPESPPGPVSYTITVTNTLPSSVPDIYIVDILPKGFAFEGTTAVTPAGSCTLLPTGGTGTPEWGDCTVPGSGEVTGGVLTIEFTARVGAEVGEGRYDNDVMVFSDEVGVQQFRSDSTDAEDVWVTVPEAAGVTVAGVVYHDLTTNGAVDGGEDWTGAPQVYVNLVKGGSVIQTATVASADGQFSFPEVEPGSYLVLLSDSDGNSAPVSPAGWLFVAPSDGQLEVEVGDEDVLALTLGLFHGTLVSGEVFRDDGLGGGIANDGVRNGGEEAVPLLSLTASAASASRVTATDSAGRYRLYLPASWGTNVQLGHDSGPGTGVSDGATLTLPAYWSDPAARATTVDATAGSEEVRDFGLVRSSELRPDQSGQAMSPGVMTYAHFYRPGTLGTVDLAVDGAHSYEFFLDTDCDGTVSDLERTPVGGNSFVVDGSWPRTDGATGELLACALEMRVLVGAGVATGRIDIATVSASLQWLNLAAAVESREVVDVTSVNEQADLTLTTTVRKMPSGTETSFERAYPGDELEYCVQYQNVGVEALTDVVINLPIPFHTRLVADPGPYTGAAEIVWDDGGTIRHLTRDADGDAAAVSGALMSLDAGNGVGTPLLAGNGGKVCFQVTVR